MVQEIKARQLQPITCINIKDLILTNKMVYLSCALNECIDIVLTAVILGGREFQGMMVAGKYK